MRAVLSQDFQTESPSIRFSGLSDGFPKSVSRSLENRLFSTPYHVFRRFPVPGKE